MGILVVCAIMPGLGDLHSLDTENEENLPENKQLARAVMAHAFNPSTWEAEAGRSQSLRPAWPVE